MELKGTLVNVWAKQALNSPLEDYSDFTAKLILLSEVLICLFKDHNLTFVEDVRKMNTNLLSTSYQTF